MLETQEPQETRGRQTRGQSHAEVLQEFPYLTEVDIRACLAYAADRERKLEISKA